jgi:hypothetical protein
MSDEKKIIIDEDWKTQIAAERAKEEQEATALKPKDEQGSKDEQGASDPNAPTGQVDLPPPSFEMLLTTLATEAMMSLGQMPIPGQQQPEVNLPQAQYVIDLISVLKEKTVGNLTNEEKTTLDDLLYQLRMMYVAVEGN